MLCVSFTQETVLYTISEQDGGNKNIQGILDGFASKSALRQDTGYMVEKTSHDITPYLGAFGAYLMPQ